MKPIIKCTISIIAIAFTSMSMAEAGERNRDTGYDRSNHKQHSRNVERRHDQNREFRKQHRQNRAVRAERRVEHRHANNHQFRKHHRQHRMKRVERRYARKHLHLNRHYRKHTRFNRHHRPYWKRGYKYRTHDHYRNHRSHTTVSHRDGHVLAGTLIGSAIANNASDGNPAATLGGAVVGAIIGNAIAHH